MLAASTLKVFSFDFVLSNVLCAFCCSSGLQFVFGSRDPDTEDIFCAFSYIYFTIYQPGHVVGVVDSGAKGEQKKNHRVFFPIYYSIKFCCFLLFIFFVFYISRLEEPARCIYFSSFSTPLCLTYFTFNIIIVIIIGFDINIIADSRKDLSQTMNSVETEV
jgi:hypothetical protein